MSERTNRVLAKAAGSDLCDCVVVGIRPDGSVYVDGTGTTIASTSLYLSLGQKVVLEAWYLAAAEIKEFENA